jgi:hypothetical protein
MIPTNATIIRKAHVFPEFPALVSRLCIGIVPAAEENFNTGKFRSMPRHAMCNGNTLD